MCVCVGGGWYNALRTRVQTQNNELHANHEKKNHEINESWAKLASTFHRHRWSHSRIQGTSSLRHKNSQVHFDDHCQRVWTDEKPEPCRLCCTCSPSMWTHIPSDIPERSARVRKRCRRQSRWSPRPLLVEPSRRKRRWNFRKVRHTRLHAPAHVDTHTHTRTRVSQILFNQKTLYTDTYTHYGFEKDSVSTH